jgi:hypothetical protein
MQLKWGNICNIKEHKIKQEELPIFSLTDVDSFSTIFVSAESLAFVLKQNLGDLPLPTLV